MTPLTDTDTVEYHLGRSLTVDELAGVDGLIEAASSRFRRAAGGRQISQSETTAVLRVNDGRVSLPQRPVTAVAEVRLLNADGTPGAALSTWSWDGLWTVALGDPAVQQLNAPSRACPVRSVAVTWTAGYDPVPEDVRNSVASMVARRLSQPGDAGSPAAGVQSETIGGYTYRLGEAAAAGLMGMTGDEQAVARAYRPAGTRTMGLSR